MDHHSRIRVYHVSYRRPRVALHQNWSIFRVLLVYQTTKPRIDIHEPVCADQRPRKEDRRKCFVSWPRGQVEMMPMYLSRRTHTYLMLLIPLLIDMEAFFFFFLMDYYVTMRVAPPIFFRLYFCSCPWRIAARVLSGIKWKHNFLCSWAPTANHCDLEAHCWVIFSITFFGHQLL